MVKARGELTPADLEVGQEVVVRNVNERRLGGAARGMVTKIGRKLVTIETSGMGWSARQYRLDTQYTNDDWGHQWFLTVDQQADEDERDTLWQRIGEHGIVQKLGGGAGAVPTEKLRIVAALLDGDHLDLDGPPAEAWNVVVDNHCPICEEYESECTCGDEP